jgi:energy-converting hydrogenase A subunit Q
MYVDLQLCDRCGTCVAVCPADAIIISEFLISLDREKCINCGNCETVCPIKAIGGEEK